MLAPIISIACKDTNFMVSEQKGCKKKRVETIRAKTHVLLTFKINTIANCSLEIFAE